MGKECAKSQEKLRQMWKGLDLVMEEVWERAGFFDTGKHQDQPTAAVS
jgi:hypothetical protein